MVSQYNLENMVDNASMPPGIVIPVLVYEDVATTVDWLCSTFGFKERLRIGKHRSQLIVERTSIVVTSYSDEPCQDDGHQSKAYSLMVRVADVDQHFNHVTKCDAHILSSPQTYPFGERQYTVKDIGGHHWTFYAIGRECRT